MCHWRKVSRAHLESMPACVLKRVRDIRGMGHGMARLSAGPRSDRDKVIATSALSVGYGREVGMIMLIYIMAFAYAAVSPIILPFTLCYFTSSWVRC